MAENLLIGCRGFEHEAWAVSFYPPEIPADWRFCYYSNEVRALLVPVEEWARLDAERVEVWRRDSDPAFRFVFEIPGQALRAEVVRHWRGVMAPIWPRIRAFVLKTGGRMPPVDIEDTLGLPCCLETAPPGRSELSRVWLPEREPEPHAGGRFLVAMLGQPKPGQSRFVLERLARWMGEKRGAALFFTDPENAADAAGEARVLAELMGL
jgi:hypothetical protein